MTLLDFHQKIKFQHYNLWHFQWDQGKDQLTLSLVFIESRALLSQQFPLKTENIEINI